MSDAGRRAWVGATMVILGAGCMEPQLYRGGAIAGPATPGPSVGGPSSPEAIDPSSPYQPIDVREGRLAGTIGDVTGLDRALPMLRGYQDEGHGAATIEVHADAEGGAAMFAAYFFPNLDSLDLPVGRRVVLEDLDLEETSISTVGCAGEVAGDWDYDAAPQRTVMSVTDFDEDGALELGFEATFGADQTESGVEETVVARFELAAP